MKHVRPAIGAAALLSLLASSATASPLPFGSGATTGSSSVATPSSDSSHRGTAFAGGLGTLLGTSRVESPDRDEATLRILDGLVISTEDIAAGSAGSVLRARVKTDASRADSRALIEVASGSARIDNRGETELLIGLPNVDGLEVDLKASSERNHSGLILDVSTETGRNRAESLVKVELGTSGIDGDRDRLTLRVDLLEGVLGSTNSDNKGDDCGLLNLSVSDKCALLNLGGGGGNGGLLGLGGGGGNGGLLNLGGGGGNGGLLNLGGGGGNGGLLNLGGNG